MRIEQTPSQSGLDDVYSLLAKLRAADVQGRLYLATDILNGNSLVLGPLTQAIKRLMDVEGVGVILVDKLFILICQNHDQLMLEEMPTSSFRAPRPARLYSHPANWGLFEPQAIHPPAGLAPPHDCADGPAGPVMVSYAPLYIAVLFAVEAIVNLQIRIAKIQLRGRRTPLGCIGGPACRGLGKADRRPGCRCPGPPPQDSCVEGQPRRLRQDGSASHTCSSPGT